MQSEKEIRWLRYYTHPDFDYPLAIVEKPGNRFVFALQAGDPEATEYSSMSEILIELAHSGHNTEYLKLTHEWELTWDPVNGASIE